jgi:hypothetical protein
MGTLVLGVPYSNTEHWSAHIATHLPWRMINPISDGNFYLHHLTTTCDLKGTVQGLKVISIERSSLRIEPLIFIF